MDKLKNINDLHLFAASLVFKLPNNELPANVKVTVDLFPDDWAELVDEIRKLPSIVQVDKVTWREDTGQVGYRHEGIRFSITNRGY